MDRKLEQEGLFKIWNPTQLMTGISCLSYGVMCLYYDQKNNHIFKCLLSIHEQYINILHVIIEGKASILFQLQNVQNIIDTNIIVSKALKSKGFNFFINIYTSVLDNHVLVMHSENQKNVIWEGLQYFVHEAKQFYTKISRFDPFKAEAMMLFMEADVDGSKLLDIDQCYQNFIKLKINVTKQQLQKNINQINEDLYVKENLKKPKDFQMNVLTTIGFEYLLRYYSMKQSLAPVYHSICPIFKYKHKRYKKSIIQILKSHNKPLMSGIQLKQFIQTYMKKNLSVQQCDNIIRTFPVYDGQGQQIPQQQELLSFNHFCNFIFTPQNSIIDPQLTKINQNMSLPMNQYYIYTSFNTYLVDNSIHADSSLRMYQICLKKGCRSVEVDIQKHEKQIVVKHKKGKSFILFREVLKTIKNLGFNINPFPIFLYVQNNCPIDSIHEVNRIFDDQIKSQLIHFDQFNKQNNLPSPLSLRKRIIIMSQHRNQQKYVKFNNKVSLSYSKFDVQRKGYKHYTFTELDAKTIIKEQALEQKNLVDIARRGLVRSIPDQKRMQNYDIFPIFRNGIQMIALNLQKQDINHYIMHSKFLQNGGKACGYLLKPHWIRGNTKQCSYSSQFNQPLKQIKLKIYAGQKLVLFNTEIQSYWVQVFLKGTLIEEKKNKIFKTDIRTDGFYADFQLQCEFTSYCPEISTIVFSVTNSNKQILGARSITVKNLRDGLRTVQLLGPGMQLRENSFILVQINQTDIKKKPQSVSIFN